MAMSLGGGTYASDVRVTGKLGTAGETTTRGGSYRPPRSVAAEICAIM